MPCSLASIPLIIGYVGTYKGDEKNKPLIYSLILAFTFTILGILSAILGKLFLAIGSLIYLILGILMIIVSLQMLDIIKLFKDHCKVQKKRKGMLGAFIFGILGVFFTPCSTTVLIAILAFVAQKGNILIGGLLLYIYSILIILVGTSFGIIKKL